jgi:hypothetical protein
MKRTIDLQSYDVQFSRLLTVEIAREHFKEYLKQQFTEELLLFLVAVDEFKKQTEKKQVTTAIHIYKTFIKAGSEQELNIQNRERDHVYALLNASEQFTKQEALLVPLTIFDRIYEIVFRELREDSFARYIRSKPFHAFVNQMGQDFIDSIAIDISMKAYQDVILRKEDFSQTSICQKDVDFFKTVLGDSTEWDQVKNAQGVFVSKTRYSMKEFNPQLLKIQGFLDCSAYQALVSGVDPIVLKKVNKGLDLQVNYLDNIDDGEYPSILRHAVLDSRIAIHDLYAVQTCLYEPSLGCYMLVIKSTDAFVQKYPLEHRALKIFHCSAFYEISENRCRYVTISWVDMGLNKVHRILEKMFFKTVIKIQAKTIHAGFVTGVEDLRETNFTPNTFEGGRSMLDTLEEFFRRNPEKNPRLS